MINFDKPLRRRNCSHPISVPWNDEHGWWFAERAGVKGWFIQGPLSRTRLDDLLENVPERVTLEVWANVYERNGERTLSTYWRKEAADACSYCGRDKRVACVPVTITYEVGEGLS